MSFNSLHFLIFLPVVLLIYWLLPHKFRWVWLIIASYYFYMSWNAWLAFLIAGTTLVSFGAALLMGRTEKKSFRKTILIITLIICLGLLIFFKYFNFLIGSVIDFLNLFSMDLNSTSFDIILPIGISFYTFQTLSYVIDAYRGSYPPGKHLGYYALFVSFFPQLVAGPIERPGNLIPQLKERHRLNFQDFSNGFRIMLTGFFRKCVIADLCGVYVNSVFADLSAANALSILLAGLLFTVQVYNDFAGYSEVATGAARMMGIKLMRNFNKPFLAVSMREFMSRWHISLTAWFKDYLYIPLGGNRKGKARMLLNILIVYLVCGFWHGANWTFVLWGLYIGIFICIEHLLHKPYRKLSEKLRIDNKNAIVILIRRIIITLLFVPASLLFRSQSIIEMGQVITMFFTNFGFGEAYMVAAMSSLNMKIMDMIQTLLCVFVMAMIYNMGEWGRNTMPMQPKNLKAERSASVRRIAGYIFITLAVAFAWLTILNSGESSAFVYFQF